MLDAQAAIKALNEIVDRPFNAIVLSEEGSSSAARCLAQVKVEIAIACVAVTNEMGFGNVLGNPVSGLSQECG